jgi:polyhydroxybutyrate depolymerase
MHTTARRSALFLAAMFAAALVALACSRESDADPGFRTTVPGVTRDATTPTPPVVSPTPAPDACGTPPADVRFGQTVVRTIQAAGEQRSYRLHVPGNAFVAGLPVVLNFHGLGSSALEQEVYSGLVPLSERESFILVTPDGTGTPRGWAVARLGNTSADDLAFVAAVLDTLEDQLCIDTSRVYSTGMSNGAFFSSLLGCVMDDRIAAIAPVAGVSWAERDTLECGRPMPIIAFHGMADGTVPFEQGLIFGAIPYAGAEANVDGWAGHNGCEPESNWSQLTEHVYRVTYEGCESPAELIAVEGGGHTWPGAFPVPSLGPTTNEISASEMIWTFFEDKRLP